MADDQRMLLLSQVAQLYYEQSATQEAIAATLNISRPTVSRLLKEAREEGVVQIVINTPFRFAADVEAELMHVFPNLRRAQVIRTSDANTVLRMAAAYIARTVKDGDVIGVSWGNTLEQLTRHLPAKPLAGATVVQLNGGVAHGADTNATEIVTRFGRAFGADPYYLQVPTVVDSPAVKQALLQNRETARVLELGQRANVAVYGIGYPAGDSVLVRAGYFTPDHVAELRRRGAVGDICSRHFTALGAVCDEELYARTIGLPLEGLRHIEHAIAVVVGVHKAAGVLGALRGGLLNELLVDEATAREALRLHKGGETADD
ncbi:MAG TPA: sugar-binding transcriptional regulator [Symbiobacteriaceae bacterium]|jgi:deoxyribonucleoside regulator